MLEVVCKLEFGIPSNVCAISMSKDDNTEDKCQQ